MLATVQSATVYGLDGIAIQVEVDLQRGLRAFQIVGMPSLAVRESRERVVSALLNCGFRFPEQRVTVNLAPADHPKEGAGFDLSMALGILAASKQCSLRLLKNTCVLGELSLNGQLRPTRGALSIALMARRMGLTRLMLPSANAAEAALVPDIKVCACDSLQEAVQHLKSASGNGSRQPPTLGNGGGEARPGIAAQTAAVPETSSGPTFSDVVGQEIAKRALAIAAAGGHHVLMEGPPGIGKSMLARAFAGLLPPLTREEVLEVRQILSVCGLHAGSAAAIVGRPFRAPHHTLTVPALVGGGRPIMPGEITRAQNGVLFLDELPEFHHGLLDLLRQPLEEGCVHLARANRQLTFPARFQLLAAMNPCPCGMLGHPKRPCRCTPGEVQRYQNRISGPILDRIDIRVRLGVPSFATEAKQDNAKENTENNEPEEVLRKNIRVARLRQARRYQDLPNVHCNAQLTTRQRKERLRIRAEAMDFLRRAMRRWHLSMRAYERTLLVARSIADLDAVSDVNIQHIAEALQYRVALRAVEV